MTADEFRTGDACFTVDRMLTVGSWNAAAERLTGISADEAIGRPCWDLLGGVGERGDTICHGDCSNARLAQQGFPVPCHSMVVRTAAGRGRVDVTTVGLADGRILHVLLPAPRPSRRPGTLTRRQRQVLDLIAAGVPAKAIGRRLGIGETTVRTYIRALLRELGAHSQLEAVAKARRAGLL